MKDIYNRDYNKIIEKRYETGFEYFSGDKVSVFNYINYLMMPEQFLKNNKYLKEDFFKKQIKEGRNQAIETLKRSGLSKEDIFGDLIEEWEKLLTNKKGYIPLYNIVNIKGKVGEYFFENYPILSCLYNDEEQEFLISFERDLNISNINKIRIKKQILNFLKEAKNSYYLDNVASINKIIHENKEESIFLIDIAAEDYLYLCDVTWDKLELSFETTHKLFKLFSRGEIGERVLMIPFDVDLAIEDKREIRNNFYKYVDNNQLIYTK